MPKPVAMLIGGVLLALTAGFAAAQPAEDAERAVGSINPYVYMRDGTGNKLYIETQFWRNDPAYDARALKRLSDVMTGLEKLGFKQNTDAANGWDKPEKVVRCRINMEATTKRWRGSSRLRFLRLCVRAPRMRMLSIEKRAKRETCYYIAFRFPADTLP